MIDKRTHHFAQYKNTRILQITARAHLPPLKNSAKQRLPLSVRFGSWLITLPSSCKCADIRTWEEGVYMDSMDAIYTVHMRMHTWMCRCTWEGVWIPWVSYIHTVQ